MQFKWKGFYSCIGKIFYVHYFKILTHTEGFSLLYININMCASVCACMHACEGKGVRQTQTHAQCMSQSGRNKLN